jgi:translation initiation factor 2B subunit (eIF-2B alpha/beta/delta family)
LFLLQINPQEGEDRARQRLMTDIDDFIHERFVMAQRVICEEGRRKLWDGDVVMTYGVSQVVMRILLKAHEVGGWAQPCPCELLYSTLALPSVVPSDPESGD